MTSALSVSSFAAAWRGSDGEVVATVPDATMCREPRHTRDLATWTEDGGFGSIMRCRNCEGCRNYDRLILRRRLAAHFENWEGNLWTVEITSSKLFKDYRNLIRQLTPGSHTVLGFIRLAADGLVFIVSSGRSSRPAVTLSRCASIKVIRIRDAQRVRTWKRPSRGMKVSRSEYGEWTNRFYIRGLKRLSATTFVNSTRGGLRKSRSGLPQSVRAVRAGAHLVPSPRVQFHQFMALQKTRRSEAQRRYPVRSPGAKAPVSGVLPRVAHTPAGCAVADDVGRENLSQRQGTPAGVRTAFKDTPDLSQGGRDAGSRLKGAAFAAQWLERMLAKHRREGP